MIKELHQKLIKGEISAVQLTEEYLTEIENQNKDLQAFLTVSKEEALLQAKEVDEKIKNGEEIDILSGIPGAIKDNILIKDIRSTAASKILDNYVAPYDATVIKRLKEKATIFLGKTNLDEFACGSSTENSGYFLTKNPRDLERVPGGSSGGSAAAVASGMAAWALGTDTGGSIRQPASFCGLVGLKPTYGRVSRYGAMAMGSSLDQIGPLTKTVEDAAIVLSAISGEAIEDATSAQSPAKDYTNFLTGDIQGKKIGVIREHLEKLDPAVKESMEQVIAQYKELGAEIKNITMPHIDYSLPVYYVIMPSEVSSNLARYDAIKYGMRVNDHKDTKVDFSPENRTLLENYLDSRCYGLGKEIKRRIMLGTYALSSGYYDAYYLKAQKVRTLIKQDFEKAFQEVDFIFSPTTPSAAFKIGENTDDPLKMYLEDIFTVPANIAGVPAISVPAPEVEVNDGSDSQKMPIGFQLMGKWFNEEGLLNIAYAYEISSKNNQNQN